MWSAGAGTPRSRVQTTTAATTTVGSLGVVLVFAQHHPRHEAEHAQAEHKVDGSKRDIEPTGHGVSVGLFGSEVKSKLHKRTWVPFRSNAGYKRRPAHCVAHRDPILIFAIPPTV